MSRWRSYGRQDDQSPILGDRQFLGVNEKLSREMLPEGTVARAINKRMRNGAAETRPGTVYPPAPNAATFGAIYGSGLYSNPNGQEVILVAAGNGVFAVRDATAPAPIALPAGETIDTPSEFVQAFDKVLLFRGPDRIPLEWNGLDPAGFTAIPDPTIPTKVRIPNAWTAANFKARLLVPVPASVALARPELDASSDNTDVAVSDIANYTRFDPILANWRANLGTSDAIVRIMPFAGNGVLIFKERSLLLMSDFTDPEHPELAQLQVINPVIGLAGRKAAVMVGADVLFLSRTGIYRVSQILQDRIATAPVPVSDPIAPVIARINWAAAGGAVAQVLGELVYFAVPLDGASYNNAVLVYNSATDRWESAPDQWDGAMHIGGLHVTSYLGQPALWAIDYTVPAVYVLYQAQSPTDLLYNGEYQIKDQLETRGYTAPAGELLSFRRVQLALATWNPTAAVIARVDGVNEQIVLTPSFITRDRRKYFTYGKPDYDPSNVNDDWAVPMREDYSVPLPVGGVYLGSGVELDRKQEAIERWPTRQTGRWLSLIVFNGQGQCDVRAVEVDAIPARRDTRRAA